MRRYVFRLAILSLAALGTGAVRGDDQQIAQQIIEKLQAEKQAGTLKGFSIDLQVDEGTVWLSGRVANEQQQAKALDLARRITGVKQVVNDLTIAAPPAKAATKSAVAARPAVQPVEIAPEALEPAAASARKSSPGNSSLLNSVSKTLLGAVHGSSPKQPEVLTSEQPRPAPQAPVAAAPATPAQPIAVQAVPIEATPAPVAAYEVPAYEPEPEQPAPLHPVTVRREVAAVTGTNPIGTGVDSGNRNVVQAAQPVVGAAPTQPLQPYAAAPANPQMAMVPVQVPYMVPVYAGSNMQVPLAMAPARPVNYNSAQFEGGGMSGAPMPMHMPGSGVGIAPARYDHPQMPGYAWPSYAAHPNYAAVTYPKQYSPTAWPYIGPFYPYPQVPLGWRKVTLEWDDGWWMLDFKDRRTMYNH